MDRSRLFDDSGGRGTWGGVYSTTLGALIHEIGHLFDLDHTDSGVMGRGFDDVMCWPLLREHSGNDSLHPPPAITGSKWWLKWGGAMFEEASLVLLSCNQWFIPGDTEVAFSSNLDNISEEEYWLVRSSGTMGTVSDTSESFNIGLCQECQEGNLAECQQDTTNLLYYDEKYVRGVRVRDVLFGDNTSQTATIPCVRTLSGVSIRAGLIIDAVKFHRTINLPQSVSGEEGWLGGEGGSMTELTLNKQFDTVVTATVSQFGGVNCVSSFQILSIAQSVDTVSVRSVWRIVALVLYCKETDRVWFFKDYRNKVDSCETSETKRIRGQNNKEKERLGAIPHERGFVQCSELKLLEDSGRSIWSIELVGNLTHCTIKAVDVKGRVRCFSL